MLTAKDRQAEIVSLILTNGHTGVSELSARFDVAAETIRRDLNALEDQGLIQRVHGGAVASNGLPDLPFRESEQSHISEKNYIAERAADLIPSRACSIFIDSGTTTARFTEELVRRYSGQPWTIVTNSLPAAMILAEGNIPNVNILGGTMKNITRAVVGSQTVTSLENMRADFAFMGTNGISEDHGLSTPDTAEASVKRAMIQGANTSILLCDSSKCGREFLVTFSSLNDIDVIVTDKDVDEKYLSLFKNYEIKVVN